MKKKLLFIVTAVTLFSFPVSNFAQTPVLGAASKFVIFTIDGAVGNTQRSNITGEVGTNVGAITGFGNVDGIIHMTPDGSTGAAVVALTTVSVDLTSRASTGTHAPALGTETILPGVYDIAGSATLNGNLTLDGGGVSTGVFIFRISGPFALTIPSSVTLTNGAVACNVFWQIGGVVSLLGGTMKGTIISGAAVNISPGVNLEGRAFSTVGAINVSQVVAYTPLGCGTPPLTGPAAPDLLTTKFFGLFTGSGALSNAGISHITGDVGSNTDNPSGFNASDVTGMIHPMPDPATGQASTDLVTVYNNLNGRIPDIELILPADLGYDLVLTPHTYLLNGATVLTGNLLLNAQGDPNAVFILKVTGAFSTGTNANVILTNGAQAKNVYWKIDGAVDIMADSHFAGTMVVAAGAIALRTGVVLDGRALSITGAVSTSSAVTTMFPDGTLPLTWVSFTGKSVGENVLLEWSTVNELNNGFFTIRKGRDGRNFETLTTISAHGEVKNSQYHYSFTDKLPYSKAYYTISQTDRDGKTSDYKTIQVNVDINQGFKGLHYVQQNYVYVRVSGAAPGNGSMKLYSIDGRLMASQAILLSKDVSTYKINRQLPKGVYMLQLESHGIRLYNQKIVVF